jgi:hypothetical protein
VFRFSPHQPQLGGVSTFIRWCVTSGRLAHHTPSLARGRTFKLRPEARWMELPRRRVWVEECSVAMLQLSEHLHSPLPQSSGG